MNPGLDFWSFRHDLKIPNSPKSSSCGVEVTLPPYLAHGRKVAGPYLDVAAAKANEAGSLAKLGLERAREALKLGL